MILETDGLTKSFGSLTAVDNVSIGIEENEVRAIIGPNGAGKTTFFNLITGTLSPSSGKVLFDGEDITDLPLHRVTQQGICRSYQITTIFEDISVFDNVWIAVQRERDIHLRPWKKRETYEEVSRRTEEIVDRIGLSHASDTKARNLPHGDKRRLDIGVALGSRPKLLLLDEPTAGMSPEETQETLKFVEELSTDYTVVLIEHDMDVVMSASDTVSVLDRGSIIATGTPDEVRENDRVQKAYLGGTA